MKFSPKSENDCRGYKLLPEATYDFVVDEAIKGKSKSGNDMITVSVAIWDGERVVTKIYDYLLEAMMFKLRHCCGALGLMNQYNSGTLEAEMLINKGGKCIVGVEPAKGEYKAKNIIKDYVPLQTQEAPLPPDDMPF